MLLRSLLIKFVMEVYFRKCMKEIIDNQYNGKNQNFSSSSRVYHGDSLYSV